MLKRLIYKFEQKKQYITDKRKFEKDKKDYMDKNTDSRFNIIETKLSPILTEYRQNAAAIGGYFWQDLWGAKRVLRDIGNNVVHYDIASRVDGFVAHLLASGKTVRLIDVRPLDIECPGLEFHQDDATDLSGILDETVYSLSALCSLEHFGLGRYNDPIKPDGAFRAFDEIQRVMAKTGRIYISLPVGKNQVLFNEERIFRAQTIVDSFKQMDLIEYSVMKEIIVENEGRRHSFDWNCDLNKYDNYDGKMLTGFFIFEKK